jgi:hypothetical protein
VKNLRAQRIGSDIPLFPATSMAQIIWVQPRPNRHWRTPSLNRRQFLLLIASDRASYITGVNITMDGMQSTVIIEEPSGAKNGAGRVLGSPMIEAASAATLHPLATD